MPLVISVQIRSFGSVIGSRFRTYTAFHRDSQSLCFVEFGLHVDEWEVMARGEINMSQDTDSRGIADMVLVGEVSKSQSLVGVEAEGRGCKVTEEMKPRLNFDTFNTRITARRNHHNPPSTNAILPEWHLQN